MARFRSVLFVCLVLALATTSVAAAGLTDSLVTGKADLKSAGALAFGPEGVLFVGDSIGGAVFAIDTGDRSPSQATAVQVTDLGTKVAAMLGLGADQIQINDVAVNPISRKTYLSVSRGRGAGATPVIVRVTPAAAMDVLQLDNVKHSKAVIPNPANSGNQNQRLQTITDLAFVDNTVYVAGLTNEEFSSNMRRIPFPFAKADKGASIEIWHGSHNQFETNSPVRTFVPYKIRNVNYILAAYTCTPLVKLPVSALNPGSKVEGTTIAELGFGNRPLDMIVYNKDGKNFILMANSDRGVMKMPADSLETYPAIKTSVPEKAGVPYQTIAALHGIVQLDAFDGVSAVVLEQAGRSLNLKTVVLP